MFLALGRRRRATRRRTTRRRTTRRNARGSSNRRRDIAARRGREARWHRCSRLGGERIPSLRIVDARRPRVRPTPQKATKREQRGSSGGWRQRHVVLVPLRASLLLSFKWTGTNRDRPPPPPLLTLPRRRTLRDATTTGQRINVPPLSSIPIEELGRLECTALSRI